MSVLHFIGIFLMGALVFAAYYACLLYASGAFDRNRENGEYALSKDELRNCLLPPFDIFFHFFVAAVFSFTLMMVIDDPAFPLIVARSPIHLVVLSLLLAAGILWICKVPKPAIDQINRMYWQERSSNELLVDYAIFGFLAYLFFRPEIYGVLFAAFYWSQLYLMQVVTLVLGITGLLLITREKRQTRRIHRRIRKHADGKRDEQLLLSTQVKIVLSLSCILLIGLWQGNKALAVYYKKRVQQSVAPVGITIETKKVSTYGPLIFEYADNHIQVPIGIGIVPFDIDRIYLSTDFSSILFQTPTVDFNAKVYNGTVKGRWRVNGSWGRHPHVESLQVNGSGIELNKHSLLKRIGLDGILEISLSTRHDPSGSTQKWKSLAGYVNITDGKLLEPAGVLSKYVIPRLPDFKLSGFFSILSDEIKYGPMSFRTPLGTSTGFGRARYTPESRTLAGTISFSFKPTKAGAKAYPASAALTTEQYLLEWSIDGSGKLTGKCNPPFPHWHNEA